MHKTWASSAAIFLAAATVIGTGCSSSNPSSTAPPTTGSLQITVTGLPSGVPAAITVTGPAGFSQVVTATTTLAALTPGMYTMTASNVVVSSAFYAPTLASDTVSVGGSTTPAAATVAYAPASVALTVTVSGLPSGAPAALTVTGPAGFSQLVTATTTLAALAPGTYTIAASDVVSDSTYAPAPLSQRITVAASVTATAAKVVYAGRGNHWTTIATMPTTRSILGIGVVNGILYAVGGATGRPRLRTVEAYHPATNSWTTQAPMPTARAGLAVGVVNGLLYAVGGNIVSGSPASVSALTTVEFYNPATDTWTARAAMPTARSGMGVGVVNGVLYVIGGWSGTADLRTVEAYDPATNMWTTKAAMPTARSVMGVSVVNGVLYVIGGSSGTAALSTVEAYDPATNTWTTKAAMPTARTGLGVSVVNGVLYAVGGQDGLVGNYLNTLEAYDPATDSWTTKEPTLGGFAPGAAGVVNGILYAVAGNPLSQSLSEAYTP